MLQFIRAARAAVAARGTPDQVEPEQLARYPHCDSRVLHAPGECDYCDQHPDWQALRAEGWRINFTGHADPDKAPCPSDAQRGLGGAHIWPGNRPA